jgi:hypothetical protein
VAQEQRELGLPGDAYSSYPLLLPVPVPGDPPAFLERASQLLDELSAGDGVPSCLCLCCLLLRLLLLAACR